MSRLTAGVALSILGIAGCGSTNMTPTGPEQKPREATCEFRIFTTAPEGYAEVAAIDVTPGAYGQNQFTDIADFKEEIRPSVCRAGGDAAIAYANGLGMYIKATVLKKVASDKTHAETQTSKHGVESAPVTAPNTDPSAAGCHYDTQCKGDRVCVKGECVDPAPTRAGAATTAGPTAAP